MLGTLISPKYRLPLELFFAVLLVVGLSMLLTGKQIDKRTSDAIRIRDMKEISVHIDGHWRAYGALPPLLTLLSNATTGGFILPSDPVSKERYGYEMTGPQTYKLCATFAEPFEPQDASDALWRHQVGRTCFDLTAGPPQSDLSSITTVKIPASSTPVR